MQTFTGTITGPSDIDTFYFSAPSGEVTGEITTTPALAIELGLYHGDVLLAVTGPNEHLYSQGPGGDYRLVVEGQGIGAYSINVPQAVLVPEPTNTIWIIAAVLIVASVILARAKR